MTRDREARTIWIVDAHRDDRKRLSVRADEKLTAFIELEWVIGLTPKSGRWTIPPFAEESEIENSS